MLVPFPFLDAYTQALFSFLIGPIILFIGIIVLITNVRSYQRRDARLGLVFLLVGVLTVFLGMWIVGPFLVLILSYMFLSFIAGIANAFGLDRISEAIQDFTKKLFEEPIERLNKLLS